MYIHIHNTHACFRSCESYDGAQLVVHKVRRIIIYTPNNSTNDNNDDNANNNDTTTTNNNDNKDK